MKYKSKKFNNDSKRLLDNIHSTVESSSCRDDITFNVLKNCGYQNVTMTGCPVWYDIDSIGKDFEGWKKFIRDNNMSFINVAVTDKLYEQAKSDPNSLVPVYPGEKGKPTTLESLNYQTIYDIFSMPKVYILDKDKKIIGKKE